MKSVKKLLCLLLAAMLLLSLLAACGQSETSEGTVQTDTANSSTASNDTDDADEEDDSASEEMADINFWYFDLRMTASDYGDHVVEAINQITEEKINTHVNITYYTVADFATNFTLAMSGGEQVDLVQLFTAAKLSTLYANSQLTDITDYMSEYAPETLELMQDYIGTYSYSGRIYGVPTLRNYVTNAYIIMRKDILDELGLTEKAENLSSWSEYEEILQAVTDAYSGTGLYGVCKGASFTLKPQIGAAYYTGDGFDTAHVYDNLGDSLNFVYTDDEGNVSLSQEIPEFKQAYEDSARWFNNGWVYPDSPMTDTHGDELMKQGVSFSSIQGSEIGIEVTKGNSIGYELVCAQIYNGIIKTGTLTGWGIGVPITSQEPEAAVKMINLLYTDADIMNLLTWGVEGVDYEIVDDQVQQVEGNHYYEADFLIGNNTLLTPLYGNGADFYDRVKSVVSAAELSPYLGFAMDTDGMDLVISQLTAVNDQYQASIYCGLYTEDLYNEFLSKLESAGIRDYLAAYQEQLNAWLAEQ